MPKTPNIGRRFIVVPFVLVVILSGLLFDSSMRSGPTTNAVVTGTVIPCAGPVIPQPSIWNGLVTLTKNGKVLSSQRVTDAHPTYTLRAAPGTYVLSSTGANGWKKVMRLGAGMKIEVTIGYACL